MSGALRIATLLVVGACSSSSSSSVDSGEQCSTTGEGGIIVDLSGAPADAPAKIALEGPGGRFEMGTGQSARVAAGTYAISGLGPVPDPRDARVVYEVPKAIDPVCVVAGPQHTAVRVMFERKTLD
jgi:hypothetical protein